MVRLLTWGVCHGTSSNTGGLSILLVASGYKMLGVRCNSVIGCRGKARSYLNPCLLLSFPLFIIINLMTSGCKMLGVRCNSVIGCRGKARSYLNPCLLLSFPLFIIINLMASGYKC